jgi:hypothetical protein
MAKTSKELASLNTGTGLKKLNARDAKLKTYDDRGTSGRDAGLTEALTRGNQIFNTHERSEDMIKRYGKDAPKGRSFMAYEGQSGTAEKKGYKNGGCVMAGRGSKYKGQM